MKFLRTLPLAMLAGLALAGCATVPSEEDRFQAAQAVLGQHIQTLASAEFGGRAPGTEGGRKTEAYIADALASYGFAPGASGDSFYQPVELVRIAPASGALVSSDLTVSSGDEALFRAGLTDANIERSRLTIYAPEAVAPPEKSLRNRTAVIFDAMLFNGKATAVFEAKPEAVIVLTEDSERFSQLQRGFSSNRLRPASDAADLPAFALLSPDASEMFARSLSHSVENLKGMASSQDSGARELRNPIDLTINANVDRVESANVIGKLPGKVEGSGALLVLAHWDHLGDSCGREGDEDRLCNGAVDNASGIGVMLEVARQIAADGGLDRDLYIMGTTAEESGLLGAEAFAKNPPMPLPTIIGAFNIDTVAIAPRGASTTVVGWGRTPLDTGIKQVVEGMGREFKVDEYTEQFVRRQDGWALLSRDVPAVLVSTSFGDADAFSAFLSGPYHGADDEWSEDIELGGATDDIFTHIALLKHFGSVATYQPGQESAESEDLMQDAIMGGGEQAGGEGGGE